MADETRKIYIEVVVEEGVAKARLIEVDRQIDSLGRSAQSTTPHVAAFSASVARSGDVAEAASRKYGILTSQLRNYSRDLVQVGSMLSLYVTAPIVAAGVAAVVFAAGFEANMVKLVTLSNVTEENMQKMRKAVLDLAPAVGIGPTALSEALLQVTSTGIRGMEAMEVLRLSAMGSAVGLGSVTEVAKTVTSAIAAYGAENMSASKAANILYKMVVEGKGELTEFAGAMGRVVGMAAMVGISMADAATFIATFTRTGGSASEAVTALRNVIQRLEIASKSTTESTLAKMGTSLAELRYQIAEKGLTPALIDLIHKTGATNDELGKLFPNVRGLAGVMTVAGVQSKDAAMIFAHLSSSADELAIAFGRTGDTIAFKWSQLKAVLEVTAITLGNALRPQILMLIPMLERWGQYLADTVGWFAKLSSGTQDLILRLVGLVALAGPLLFFLGGILRLITVVRDLKVLLSGLNFTANFSSLVAAGAYGIPLANASLLTLSATIGLLILDLWALKKIGELLDLSWHTLFTKPAQDAADATQKLSQDTDTMALAMQIWTEKGLRPTRINLESARLVIAEYNKELRAKTLVTVAATEVEQKHAEASAAANKIFDDELATLQKRYAQMTESVPVVTAFFSGLTTSQREGAAAAEVLLPLLDKWLKYGVQMPPMLAAWYDAHKLLTAEEKRFAEAVANTNSVMAEQGATWRTTVAALDQGLVREIEKKMRAGVPSGDIKAIYVDQFAALTEAQLRAIEAKGRAEKNDAERTIQLTAQTSSALASLEDDRLSQQIARIDAHYRAVTAEQEAEVAAGRLTSVNVMGIWTARWAAIGAAWMKWARDQEAALSALDLEYQRQVMANEGDTMEAKLRLNDLELRARLDSAAKRGQLSDEIRASEVRNAEQAAQAIIHSYDPVWEAWLGLNRDMRKDWAATLDGALAGTQSWVTALLQPFISLGVQIRKIFAGVLSDILTSFLNPLLTAVKGYIGRLVGAWTVSSGSAAAGSAMAGSAAIAGLGIMPGLGFGAGSATGAGTGAGGANMAKAGGAAAALVGASLWASGKGGAWGQVGSGALTGAGVGTMFAPGIGTAIGAGIGALAGLVTSLFLKTEGKQVNDLRDAFLTTQGGYSALYEKLRATNDEHAAQLLWEARTMAQWNTAYALVNTALDAQATKQKLINDLTERQSVVTSRIAETEKALADARATFAASTNASAATSLMEKYGITLIDQSKPASDLGRDAGAAVQQLVLNQTAVGLLNDWQAWQKMGGSPNAMMVGMAKSMSELVQHALATGSTLPENMRSMIALFQANGLLTDTAGQKYATLDQLRWGAVIETEIEKQVAAIDRLVAELSDLNATLAQTNSELKAAIAAITPSAPGTGGGGGGGRQTINVLLDDRVLISAIVDGMPGELTLRSARGNT